MSRSTCKVLYVSGEISPFVRVSSLADFMASFPQAMEDEGCEARIGFVCFQWFSEHYFGFRAVSVEGVVGDRRRKNQCVSQGRCGYIPVEAEMDSFGRDIDGRRGRVHGKNLQRFVIPRASCRWAIMRTCRKE